MKGLLNFDSKLTFLSYFMMNTIPLRVTKMLMTSNKMMGSLRNILAKMTTQTGEAALIMLASAMGMCFRP